MDSKLDKKNFLWNALGSFSSAFTSLIFLIIVTRINGVDSAGIFTFAFTTACLLQVIGTYSGRAFQVTNTDESILDTDFIYSRVISCIIMILTVIVFLLFNDYSLIKNSILIILTAYKALEAFSDCLYGIIQKNNQLYKVGISLFNKSILGVFIFLIINIITKNLIISLISLVLSNIILLIVYDIANVIKCNYKKEKFYILNIYKIFKYGFFIFIFTILTQYVINAPKYAIDELLENKYQTIYGIIAMPATFMILCSQFFIHPFLTKMTENLKHKKIHNFIKLVTKISLCILIIGFLAVMGLLFLGIPLLELLYGVELNEYLNELIIIIVGATFFGISYILSNSLIAMGKYFIQTVAFTVVSIFAFVLSKILVNNIGVLGASLSYFYTMLVLLILYIIIFIAVVIRWWKNEKSISNSSGL